jgi:hypothetical protein
MAKGRSLCASVGSRRHGDVTRTRSPRLGIWTDTAETRMDLVMLDMVLVVGNSRQSKAPVAIT